VSHTGLEPAPLASAQAFILHPTRRGGARSNPRLRSDNEISGTVPPSLAALPLVKLQLQSNALSGTLPEGLFRHAVGGAFPPREVGLSNNPQLSGCLPWSHELRGARPDSLYASRITACDAAGGMDGTGDRHVKAADEL